MNVNPVKQIFKCFACGAGGDVLKFIQMREGLTFPQAIERLAERAGIELQAGPPCHAAPRRDSPMTSIRTCWRGSTSGRRSSSSSA